MSRGSVRYFFGDDTYQARLAVEQLARELKARVVVLDKNDVKEFTPYQWLTQRSRGLFDSELLVFRGVSSWPKYLQDNLVETIEEKQNIQCIVWEIGQPDKRTRLFKQLKDQATEFNAWYISQTVDWLIVEAKKLSVELKTEVAHKLVEVVGEDKWRLLSELQILLLRYENPTVDDINDELLKSPEAEIFSLLDSLFRGNKKYVIDSAQTLLRNGDSEFYILSMLAYQFRTLLLISTGITEGKNQFNMVREAGLKQFVIQKNYNIAKNKPVEYWRNWLTRILATDNSIRQGIVDGRTGLLMLILSLTESNMGK